MEKKAWELAGLHRHDSQHEENAHVLGCPPAEWDFAAISPIERLERVQRFSKVQHQLP